MKSFFEKRYRELGGKVVKIRLQQSLRLNTLRCTEKKLLERFDATGIKVERIPFLKYGYRVKKSRVSPGATTEYLLGHYYLQETAAQVPVQVLNPQKGERVLDCCAAPGGKTTQIAQWMKNTGELVACELKKHRLESLKVNLERMGITNCAAYHRDTTKIEMKPFDKILVDAPCSGNYAGDPRWFQKRDYEGVLISQKIQRKILKNAVSLLKKGGILVYATCSLEPEENEMNIDWALANLPVTLLSTGLSIGDAGYTKVFGKKLHPDVAKTRRFWPHKTQTQGFFVAKLQKC